MIVANSKLRNCGKFSDCLPYGQFIGIDGNSNISIFQCYVHNAKDIRRKINLFDSLFSGSFYVVYRKGHYLYFLIWRGHRFNYNSTFFKKVNLGEEFVFLINSSPVGFRNYSSFFFDLLSKSNLYEFR